MVTNGDRLSSPRQCTGVKLSLQGTPIEVDFLLLSLKECDVVLGVQWLGTLGPILWDFERIQMQFSTVARRKLQLQGSTSSELQALEGDTVSRMLRQVRVGNYFTALLNPT